MKTYMFHFNTEYAAYLRDAVNDRQKQSIDNVHNEKQTKGEYFAWNRTCAAMDRLEDTLSYLQESKTEIDPMTRETYNYYKGILTEESS